MLMAGQVPLCLALLWVVLRSAAALPSPSEPIYEDQVYQEQQQAAAPIGRPDFQGADWQCSVAQQDALLYLVREHLCHLACVLCSSST